MISTGSIRRTTDARSFLKSRARSLDPSPETVERIRARIMANIALPDKSAMLARYRDACAGLAAVKDKASDEFLYSAVYRNQARKAALSCGATLLELREIEGGTQ